jgi:hypothetical protein
VPIPGFERYRISEDGVVFGVVAGGRPLRAHPSKKGYLRVSLCRDGKAYVRYIHVLICLSFHGPKPHPRFHASHLDGNKLNNHASNLAWETPEQNYRRRYEQDDTQYATGERQGLARLTEDQVREIRASNETHRVLAERFGVSRPTITSVRTRRTWKHVPERRSA